MIFFVTVRLSETVHAQGLGFTKTLYAYVWAASADHASHLSTAWYQHKGCVVDKSSSTPALHQELRTFAMPESIINIPESMLQQEYDRRGWPDSLREPARRVPASMMH